MKNDPLRVLHLPESTGGMAFSLSRGERQLNLKSDVLHLYKTYLEYPSDFCLNLTGESSRAKRAFKQSLAFLKFRKKYDVFHFNYGQSLINFPTWNLNMVDLPLYPKRSKIFVTYQGCDIRQKFPTMKRAELAACHEVTCYGGQCNSGQLDKFRRAGAEKMAKYVDHIWAVNPDLLYFLPKEKSSFLPYSITAENMAPTLNFSTKKKLKIVHAPTQLVAKGTPFILSAIERLKATHGEFFEFEMVQNRSHEAAMEIYKTADLIVDQLLIGWYGGFAVECMLMGKPVIARVESKDLHFIPPEMAKSLSESLIQATPSNIYEVLAKCIEDRAMLQRVAEAGFNYARKWHDPKYVASLTNELYQRV